MIEHFQGQLDKIEGPVGLLYYLEEEPCVFLSMIDDLDSSIAEKIEKLNLAKKSPKQYTVKRFPVEKKSTKITTLEEYEFLGMSNRLPILKKKA